MSWTSVHDSCTQSEDSQKTLAKKEAKHTHSFTVWFHLHKVWNLTKLNNMI